MKELSIEQKARRYDEAIARANEMIKAMTNIGGVAKVDDIQYIFPELKESEEERVRTCIEDLIKENTFSNIYGVTKEECLAWVERQCEKGINGNDREIPFSEQILANSAKTCKDEHKPSENKGMNLVEEEMTPFQKKVFCIIDTTVEEEHGLKQVCDELFALASNEIKQNHAWSEEDEVGLGDAMWAIQQARTIAKDENDMGNLWFAEKWLKSLKDRVQPKPTWKPSEAQMKLLREVQQALLGKDCHNRFVNFMCELKQLMEE